MLLEIVKIAKQHNIIIVSDEVYRPLFHSIDQSDPEFPPSVLSLEYSNVLVTGSLSKAYSLAGIRIGWIASPSSELIQECSRGRDYTTISVSQLDDRVATFALTPGTVGRILEHNRQLANTNLAMLEAFIERNSDTCDWVRPVGCTTAFIRVRKNGVPVDSGKFSSLLLEKKGVLVAPGSNCFGEEFKGFFRMGFACQTDVLKGGLEALEAFLNEDLAAVMA